MRNAYLCFATIVLAIGATDIVVAKEKTFGEVVNLSGGIASLGEYYVHVELGNPVQRLRVQVDTGSSSLVLPGDKCSSCHKTSLTPEDVIENSLNVEQGEKPSSKNFQTAFVNHAAMPRQHKAKFYSSATSTTAKPVPCSSSQCGSDTCSELGCLLPSNMCPGDTNNACCSLESPDLCGFFLRYGGDSEYRVTASGVLVGESLRIGRHTALQARATIYQTMTETGPWPSQVDGILGMAFGRLNCNPTCTTPAFESVLRIAGESSGKGNVFAMCFGDQGGKLVLGGDGKEYRLNRGEVHYVPLVGPVSTYYVVETMGIGVGRKRLLSTQSEAIVDSGTTLLLLQTHLWNAFVRHMTEHYCHLPGVCTDSIKNSIFTQGVCLTVPPIDFPKFSLHLANGVRLLLDPQLYFIEYEDVSSPTFFPSVVYCLGIQPGGPLRTVIGDTVMRGFLTVFDREDYRVGFASANPSECTSMKPATSGKVMTNQSEAFQDGSATTTVGGMFSTNISTNTFMAGVLTGVTVLLILYWFVSTKNMYYRPVPGGIEQLDIGPNAHFAQRAEKRKTFGTFEKPQAL